MDEINDYMFVFYWKHKSDTEWLISQPVSLGEIIDRDVEFEFMDGESLPIYDIDWENNDVRVVQVPARSYIHTKKEK